MKTTIELPDALMRDVKIRAVHEGKKLKEIMADLLRKGLDVQAQAPTAAESPRVTRDAQTGLPLICCRHPAPPDAELTPERLADILLEQEATWQNDAGRH